MPLVTSAAVDMYLQIKDTKGEARVVRCADGACLINGLAVGTYSVLVCDASVQSSGKRMHKPITITAEVGRGAAAQNTNAIDEPGVQVAIGVNAAATDAAVAKITKTRSNIQNN